MRCGVIRRAVMPAVCVSRPALGAIASASPAGVRCVRSRCVKVCGCAELGPEVNESATRALRRSRVVERRVLFCYELTFSQEVTSCHIPESMGGLGPLSAPLLGRAPERQCIPRRALGGVALCLTTLLCWPALLRESASPSVLLGGAAGYWHGVSLGGVRDRRNRTCDLGFTLSLLTSHFDLR